jgi:hypothetical protein
MMTKFSLLPDLGVAVKVAGVEADQSISKSIRNVSHKVTGCLKGFKNICVIIYPILWDIYDHLQAY